MSDVDISKRKQEHIQIASSLGSRFRHKTTLLEEVELVHQALPEAALDEVDLSVELFGKVLQAPLYISGMTGGTPEARAINRGLARVADRLGLGFGLGSQRAMLRRPELRDTYAVRDVAPDVLLFSNVGVVQLAQTSEEALRRLLADVGADALCVHLNPAQELAQNDAEGDRDFRGGLDAITRAVLGCGRPVIVKETGCGLSRQAGEALSARGVAALDVAGAGGTSWVAVEALRAPTDEDRAYGEELWDWGIPTAASLVALDGLPAARLASGGVRTGLEAAKALALGASAVGAAAEVLRAFQAGGEAGAERFLRGMIRSIRSVMLLCGARSVPALWKVPRVLGPTLQEWRRALRGAP